MSRSYAAALPTAFISLRILVVLNIVAGAGILALLAAMIVMPAWTLAALGLPSAGGAMLSGFCAIPALGLIAVVLNNVVLRRLLAIVRTVRVGDPFIAANAIRLQDIAWALLGGQLLSLAIGGIGRALSTPAHPLHLDAGFSTSGWLAVLLTFILARIFAEGALMRDDLEGTV